MEYIMLQYPTIYDVWNVSYNNIPKYNVWNISYSNISKLITEET